VAKTRPPLPPGPYLVVGLARSGLAAALERQAHGIGVRHVARERFGNSGWECSRILEALDDTSELYFDRVSQIQMNPQRGLWTPRCHHRRPTNRSCVRSRSRRRTLLSGPTA